MKPVEFKLIMNTSQSAEACTVEIKGSNRQVSQCHFKEEVSCEIVKSQGPADNLLPSEHSHKWFLMAVAITYLKKLEVCEAKRKKIQC